ncbi:type VI secretion system protein TssA [Paraburkholderia edwinii]|jgi:type VI secretion system protein ImpA|uniref:Type VI secretion system protein TssA n=1 Tax=Paraburkholderia edwinii TaxID=2861782 RepID=A0ABX8UWU2_9BURK|nr:type VI secretion system protein TssA [Paraburkholderia edwinii]QYD71380.1 type VI secretion system protein TssA [Paraburkholderia edwinii]
MPSFDPSSLLRPIDDASPAGPNLEYDPDFAELERLATPRSERSIGDNVKAAEEPDWDRVADAAEALFSRTKDLRVAIYLTAACTRRDGLAGWHAGLRLVHGLLDEFWEGVHPQLDADDDNDPTARSNALMPLGDAQSVLSHFRAAPFVESPRLGRFSLRDLRIATGALNVASSENSSGPQPTAVELEACCMDCAEQQLRDTAAALDASLAHARAIDAMLGERLGTASPDLTPLVADIVEIKKFVDAQCARRFPDMAALQMAQGAQEPQGGGPDGSSSASAPALAAKIRSSNDVLLRIDEICEYFERNEPSSPVPILLKRARRLVGMNFSDVLKNIAPGAMSDLQTLVGPEDDDDNR